MNKICLLFCLVLSTCISFGQIDYRDYQKQYLLSCTRMDSASVMSSYRLLDSLNQYEITGGRDRFLYDFGMACYGKYGRWKNKEDLKKALYNFQEGYDTYKGSEFAWNLSFMHKLSGNCDLAIAYAKIYEDLRTKEEMEINYQQLYYIYKTCCDQ